MLVFVFSQLLKDFNILLAKTKSSSIYSRPSTDGHQAEALVSHGHFLLQLLQQTGGMKESLSTGVSLVLVLNDVYLLCSALFSDWTCTVHHTVAMYTFH